MKLKPSHKIFIEWNPLDWMLWGTFRVSRPVMYAHGVMLVVDVVTRCYGPITITSKYPREEKW